MKKLAGILLISVSILMAMITYETNDDYIAGDEDSPSLWGTVTTELLVS